MKNYNPSESTEVQKSCTRAEIEEKKRIAKERLLQNRNAAAAPAGRNHPLSTHNLNASTSTSFNVRNSVPVPSQTFLPQQSTSFGNYPPRNFPINNTNQQPSSPPILSKHFYMQKPIQQTNNSPIRHRNSLPLQKFNSNSNPTSRSCKQSLFTDTKTATCILTSPNHFQVKLSKYSNVAIEVFRTIPSKTYDTKTSNWSFSLQDYDLLLTKLEHLRSELAVVKLPTWIHLLNKSKRDDSTLCYDFSHIDEELRDTLMPFQEEALCFAIERQGRCFIADEMGLGKTIEALAIAAYYRQDWPVLVVTTASTCANWETTITRYLPSVPLMNIQLLSTRNDYIETPSIIITSYDRMTRITDELVSSQCGICIFDESHILKNFKTKCFKSALALSKIARRVILLSGTPALSKPSELFTQLQLIDESFFGHFVEFSKRYCEGRESAFGWDSSGRSNLEELQVVLEERFMIRRTKAGLSALNLPEKLQEIVSLDMSTVHLNVEEKKELEQLQGIDFEKVIKNDRQILPFFHNTAQIKIPAVCSYIVKLLQEEERKFIVFAHHMNMLDAVERVVQKSKKEYIRIDGKTSNRECLVRKFQMDENVVCALLSITTANAGITLTAAQVVVFTELHWTPSILAQAEARAHRIGQTHPVTIRYLIAPKTVDDYIWPMLQRKQKTLKDMKLTSESFDNLKTLAKPSPTQSNDIRNYFAPSPSKRSRDDVENAEEGRPVNKVPKTASSTSIGGTPQGATSSEDFVDDADLDQFFSTFSTQKLPTPKRADDEQFDDLFNDGMDEYLRLFEVQF